MFICENIQTSSITWTEHVIFRTMNTHMHAITFEGKCGEEYVEIWRAEGKDRNVEN